MIHPTNKQPSVVDVYASETRFQAAEQEYRDLMRSLKFTCLGKERSTRECLRAAQLNADMQAELIKMSDVLLNVDPSMPSQPSVAAQQRKLQQLSDELTTEYEDLTLNQGLDDAEVKSTMSQYQVLAWVLVSLVALVIIIKLNEINVADYSGLVTWAVPVRLPRLPFR